MRYFIAFFVLISVVFEMNNARGQHTVYGRLSIRIEHVFDGQPLMLNERLYKAGAGDSIYLGTYKYYLSNITLVSQEKIFAEEESYHLVNEARPSSKSFFLDVPEGTYSSITFMVGVDSLHNVSGAQTDALDPINAMFWDWHTGYIMAKLEGVIKNVEQKEISFHIGGFASVNNTVRKVTLKFKEPVKVRGDNTPVVILRSDVAEWFKTPYLIDLKKTSVVTTEGADAVRIADNYADMFTLGYVE